MPEFLRPMTMSRTRHLPGIDARAIAALRRGCSWCQENHPPDAALECGAGVRSRIVAMAFAFLLVPRALEALVHICDEL
jgi:hypothetical protein